MPGPRMHCRWSLQPLPGLQPLPVRGRARQACWWPRSGSGETAPLGLGLPEAACRCSLTSEIHFRAESSKQGPSRTGVGPAHRHGVGEQAGSGSGGLGWVGVSARRLTPRSTALRPQLALSWGPPTPLWGCPVDRAAAPAGSAVLTQGHRRGAPGQACVEVMCQAEQGHLLSLCIF